MPADYLLSVDLGTSHTVAVVVWPDGRTRPLLFDGSPVMPSAVFLDEAGTVHVGRDAERLGSTAPERFEPNPKQRIADGTILLGDRELPVTAAFAAILARVARACVEAVGGLPRTVMTCPADWSEQRRASLHDAAAQAGYQPVQLITEPVAAAHYYTTRLAHPIDPGQALAVFDFGGGTLDIAVVERRRDGSFGVLADGGLSDLGGLDIDAALVAHIGETVSQRDPELWKRLEQPATANELRDRRALWNDVRGAKEMLSRTSVAPVAVPDLEQALHLTRGELDQLARPLLSRAVGETRRVIGLTGRSPEQLAGIFLVGGSSRMPLVSKVLHEELGIAPTVLEQPELPVSEGAAVALDGPAPVTPPVMSPPPTQSPATAASLPPRTPPGDGTLPLHMPGAGKQSKARRNKFIAIAAGIAVLAIAAPLLWWYFTNPYKQRDFIELTEVGDTTAFGTEANGSLYDVRVRGERALFAYTAGGVGDEEELRLRALDAESGEPLWDEKTIDGDGWNNGFYYSEEILTFSQETENTAGETEYTWYFLDWETGETLGEVTRPSSEAARSGDQLVSAWEGGTTVTVYDREGEEQHSWDVGDEEESVGIVKWGLAEPADDLARPTAQDNGDGRVWALTSDGVVHVLDIESGEKIVSRAIESTEDGYYAFNGSMYVVAAEESGYRINVYDLETLEETGNDRVRPEEDGEDLEPSGMTPCGEHRMCVQELRGDAVAGSGPYTYSVYDAEDGEVAHTFDEYEYGGIEAVGDRLLVEYYEGENVRTLIYDNDFEQVDDSRDETFHGIDGGSALSYPSGSTILEPGTVVGLGVRDGSRHLLEAELEAYDCAASDMHLACFIEGGMQIYAFRE
ncbi:Hsp70 family protein [Glycomyces tenuis]|uniref:Hsp70 family protein n=1 Tax=Glycomyces tenuis TaxID=58116 RepID=UPI0004161B37|nr:Hsp70 family protein [Glycomyces tenuis]